MVIIMKGTLGSFIKQAKIEVRYPAVNFNKFSNFLIKKQLKGVINHVANAAGKFLAQL